MTDELSELLMDDETFGELVESVRNERAAAGLNPDTGQPSRKPDNA